MESTLLTLFNAFGGLGLFLFKHDRYDRWT